ncbi:MAG: ATP-binding protein [Clostridiaceae bacterium]
MYIKKRLKISYIAMLVIPFILIILLNSLFFTFFQGITGGSINKRFSLNKANYSLEILKSTSSFSRLVNNQILLDSDKFLNTDYVEELEKTISLNYAGVVVRKDNDIIYASNIIKDTLSTTLLPEFASNTLDQTKLFDSQNNSMSLSQQDFYFKDGSKGSVFYLINTNTISSLFKESILFISICILIIVSLTNGFLTYLVSKSITKPLKELGHAANEIKKGNLNYKIESRSNDEIGEFCDSFEEMRLRLKKSLELQEHYEENRKELISSISHDLKTPITSIKGYIEGIKDGIADTPSKMNRYINTIYTKANYMDTLIDDLFLFSKLDLKKVSFDFQIVDIGGFIKDYIEEISFDLDKNSIEVLLNIPSKPIMVKADVQKIKRVIMNIIDNSIKYKSSEKLKIEITVKDNIDYSLIEIKDNGKGISGDALPFIFDRFFRADTFRETSSGGSGLGLSIVKKIVEEHNGKIFAESELNKGTTVSFTLEKQSLEVK